MSTNSWSTPPFPIEKGVFQGDTLSPLIFLLCFNPIVKLATALEGHGFSLQSPIPDSEGLPPVGSHLYVEWKEPHSADPAGYYLCSVLEHYPDGSTSIMYLCDNATERINLHSIFWEFTRKNSKKFLPLGSSIKKFPLKKVRDEATKQKYTRSKEHKVKAFADDLTLIHSSSVDHQKYLRSMLNAETWTWL